MSNSDLSRTWERVAPGSYKAKICVIKGEGYESFCAFESLIMIYYLINEEISFKMSMEFTATHCNG